MRGKIVLCLCVIIISIVIIDCAAAKKSKSNKVFKAPTSKQLVLQRRETNPIDFTRLVVMRLVYGVSRVMGFDEPLSGVLNGAFVPPGADDDYDLDFEDDDDDDEGGFFNFGR